MSMNIPVAADAIMDGVGRRRCRLKPNAIRHRNVIETFIFEQNQKKGESPIQKLGMHQMQELENINASRHSQYISYAILLR